jgi:hypothetical protein
MIIQDFRSSDDKGVINSLNMNLNSSPLILELKMNMADTSGIATNVNSYLELSSEVVISADGLCSMSIVTKYGVKPPTLFIIFFVFFHYYDYMSKNVIIIIIKILH